MGTMARIELTSGDILRADAEAIVNTVNCEGFMGRGIAAQFKRSFPENFKAYAAACKRGEVVPGKMFIYETGTLTQPRVVVNFPTKRHWRAKSRLEDIESGLQALVEEVGNRGIRSIAIPPLGCGLGGLDWAVVRPRIEQAFAPLHDVRVIVFEPAGTPDAKQMRPSKEAPKLTPGRAVLISLMDRYLAGLMDPFVSLLEVHKLMYFAQEAGEPLKLRFNAAPYGPYAENLRHVLAQVEGHLVTGYADGGDDPTKALEILPGATQMASAALVAEVETTKRLERVSALVDGFETPFGLELLATVHWVVKREQGTRSTVVERVHSWNERKQSMSERQILLALDRLEQQGWLAGSAAIPTS